VPCSHIHLNFDFLGAATITSFLHFQRDLKKCQTDEVFAQVPKMAPHLLWQPLPLLCPPEQRLPNSGVPVGKSFMVITTALSTEPM